MQEVRVKMKTSPRHIEDRSPANVKLALWQLRGGVQIVGEMLHKPEVLWENRTQRKESILPAQSWGQAEVTAPG